MAFRRYAEEVIGRLHRYQRRGLGKVLELCSVSDGSETVPMVGFRTMGKPAAVVTARHHSPDLFCTDEAIYRMISRGQRGLTAVPVVDVASYDAAQNKFDRWIREYPDEVGGFLEDVFIDRGRPHWSGVPIKDWSYWRYGEDDASPQARAVQSLIEDTNPGLLLDLHGCRGGYIFLSGSVSADCAPLERAMLRSLITRGEMVHEGQANLGTFPTAAKGFYIYEMLEGDVCSYAAGLGIPGYYVCVPFFRRYPNRVALRGKSRLLASNVALLSAAVEAGRKM